MMQNEIVTTKIFREINAQDRSILYRNKNRDNFSNNLYYKTYGINDISQSVNEFNRFSGVVNDGLRVDLKVNEPYFKIFTDIKMPSIYRKDGQIYELVTLLEEEARAISVYINGKKIPDNVIKLYISVNGTDIFIPYSYLNLNKEFDVYIEDLIFRSKEYIHTYIKLNNSSTITIDLNGVDNYFDYDSFDKKRIMIYNNGYLISEDFRASCDKNNKTITVESNLSIGKEVEVFYNHFISYKKVSEGSFKGKKFYFKIDKEYQDLLYGPIPKRSCLFFRNGIRCKQNEINQLTRQLYQIEFEEDMNFSNLIVYIQDIDRRNDASHVSYNSDYYFQKMLGENRIIKGLEGEKTETAFDDFKNEINYNKIFNDENKRYNDKLADQYLYKSTLNEAADVNYVEKLKELFDRNPSIIRELLRKFGRTIYSYMITKKTEDYYVSAKTVPPDDKELSLDIFLNWNHLEPSAYEVSVLNNIYTIKIPKELLTEPINFLEVNESVVSKDYTKIKFLEFEPGSINVPDSKDYEGTLVIPKNIIDEYTTNTNNIVFIEYTSNDPNYIYINDHKAGYKYIENVDIDITESNYRFNFTTKPTNKFILYFTNFSLQGRIIYNKIDNLSGENRLFIHTGTEDDPKPIISNSIPELYVNNKFFIYGVDYVYSTPVNNSLIAGSMFSFNTPINNGDIITYSFSGLNNKSIIENKGIKFKHNSKYGLLYLSALEFPFYSDYFDLYIDGKKVFKTDIDILSDKLLRIRNIPVPFNDIYLQTKFSYDYEDLQFLFDLYKEDEWELVVEKLFKSVDPTDPNTSGESDYKPDDIFESFEDDIGENPTIPGSGGKEPNPENPEEAPERQNYLLTMYLKWLISDDARTVVFNDVEINQKVYDYFKIYQVTSQDIDILIECDLANIQDTKNYHLEANIQNMSVSERMNFILSELKKYGKTDFNLHELFDYFINNQVSNKILPLDFPYKKDKKGQLIGSDSNIIYFEENSEVPFTEKKIIEDLELKVTFNEKNLKLTKNAFLFVYSDGNLSYQIDNDNVIIEHIENPDIGNYYKITGAATGSSIITFTAVKDGFNTIQKEVKINVIEQGRLEVPNNNISIIEETEQEIDIITNLLDIDLYYNKEIINVEFDNVRKKLKITALKKGDTTILLRSEEMDGNWLKAEINVTVSLKPKVILSSNINSINQFLDEAEIIKILITSNINSFEYEIDSNIENSITSSKENMTLNIIPNKACAGSIKIIGTAENYKSAELVIPFEFKQRMTTILRTDINEINTSEEKIVNMNIYTDAETYSLETNPDDVFKINKLGNYVTLKALKESNGFITIKAKDRDKYENEITIPFTIAPMEVTQLSANVSNLGLSKGEIATIEVYTNASTIDAKLNISSAATVVIDNKRKLITIVAKESGDSILTITATAQECKQNTITIPINIQ